jgi:hypothetical protein
MATAEQTPPDNGPGRKRATEGNRLLPSAESIRSIGGLVSVVIGVFAITVLAVATMAFVDSGRDANTMIPLATAAFGVISALVGAYLGIKIGTDQSKVVAESASQGADRLAAMQDKRDAERHDNPES